MFVNMRMPEVDVGKLEAGERRVFGLLSHLQVM